MSSKINVMAVFTGHLSTLRNESGRLVVLDFLVFFILPIVIGAASIWLGLDFTKDSIGIMVSVGAILTGLLLNLLILVYDQKKSLPKVDVANDPDWRNVQLRHNTLKELYYNISYSTIISLAIALFSVAHLLLAKWKPSITYSNNILPLDIKIDVSGWLLTPIILILSLNVILTILMIIKRIYVLLTTHD